MRHSTSDGGMDASSMVWLKELEDENRFLKKMYTEERLKSERRKETLGKVVKPARRRELSQVEVSQHGISIHLAYPAHA